MKISGFDRCCRFFGNLLVLRVENHKGSVEFEKYSFRSPTGVGGRKIYFSTLNGSRGSRVGGLKILGHFNLLFKKNFISLQTVVLATYKSLIIPNNKNHSIGLDRIR